MAALIIHTPSGQNLVFDSVPLYPDLIEEVENLLGFRPIRLSCRSSDLPSIPIDSEEALRTMLETENIPLHLDVVREGERCLYCEDELGDSQCKRCGTEDWDVWLMSKHGVEVWVSYTGVQTNKEEQVPLMEDYSGEEKDSQRKDEVGDYEELPESAAAEAGSQDEPILSGDLERKGGESGCESDIEADIDADIEADDEEEAETPSSKPDSQRDYPTVQPSELPSEQTPLPRRSVPFSSPYLQSSRVSKSHVSQSKPSLPPQATISRTPASIKTAVPVNSEAALPLSMHRPLPQPALSNYGPANRLCEGCLRNVPWYLPACPNCEARESLAHLASAGYKAKIQSYL